MSIVCGTDGPEPSRSALEIAEHLARRMALPLHHMPKSSEDRLLDAVRSHSAQLLVVPAGLDADRIAQRATVPFLVTRQGQAFDGWMKGERPLRVLVGFDFSAPAAAAVQWVDLLRRVGPCEVVAAHVYWPPEQFQRLGLGGIRSFVEPDPEVTRTLERELADRLATITESKGIKLRLEPHLGRVGDRLVDMAVEEHADLLVVGSHGRRAIQLLWEGSVSRSALRAASMSIAVVPARAELPARHPTVRTVLVATDLSALGNSAVDQAFRVAGEGATVHLVHVVPPVIHAMAVPRDIFIPEDAYTDAAKQVVVELQKLVPQGARAQHEIHILESSEPAQAIYQAAERVGADLICMGTQGRSGISKLLLGSVAQGVLAKSRRPVLLCRS